MKRFTLLDTPLPGLMVLKRELIQDSRGSLTRLFCNRELLHCGWQTPVAQINHTSTAQKGTIRGMHFQKPPHQEKKLITCLQGEIWDVAVDIRADSPTFLQWYGCRLSAGNLLSFLIPEGFAHGFQTLTDSVVLVYCHSSEYNAHAEGGLNPQDSRLMINWPVAVTEISKRDRSHPDIPKDFAGVCL